MLVSIDITKGNYSTLATFDSSGQLGADWAALCAMHDVPPVLARAKGFRQRVFGRLETAPLQHCMHTNTVALMHALEDDLEWLDAAESRKGSPRVVALSPDEVVVGLGRPSDEARARHSQLMDAIGRVPTKTPC